MIRKFAGTAILVGVFAAVPPIAFAADEAGCAAEWTQAIQRGSHDSRGRIPRGTYNGPERRRAGKMPPP